MFYLKLLAILSFLLLGFSTIPTWAKEFNAYAPPMFWGPWVNIRNQMGIWGGGSDSSFPIKISYEVVGNTAVYGQVRYCNAKREMVVDKFFQTITIQHGNCIARVDVRFKGAPLGSAVKVSTP